MSSSSLPAADDWLALEPPRVPAAVLQHEPVPSREASKRLPRRHNGTEESARRELADLRRRFSLVQRAYIDAMVQSRFNRSNAGKLLAAAGLNVSPATRQRWNRRADFRRALQLAEELLLTELNINPGRVLLRNEQLVEHAMEEIAVRLRDGSVLTDPVTQEPVTTMRDPELALKANSKLGEHFRLWGDDDRSTRVVVNVVDLTGQTKLEDQGEVIDGTAERVP